MKILIGAAVCTLTLSLIFLVPAVLYIWTLDNRVILDEHDPAYPAIAGPVIYPLPPATEVPGPTEASKLLDTITPEDHEESAKTLRPRKPNKRLPTLTPSGNHSLTPLTDLYADAEWDEDLYV